MFGKNPKRGREKGDGTTLLVQEIFPTLQGEGPYTGVDSVFIRLGGCNLTCHFCDTEFEDFTPMTLEEILAEVSTLSLPPCGGVQSALQIGWGGNPLASNPPPNRLSLCSASWTPPQGGSDRERLPLIVITGGEPMRQPIAPLCEALLARGHKVQIETNGTLWQSLPDAVEMICSPKIIASGYTTPDARLMPRLTGLKFIISRQPPYHELPDYALTTKTPVWLQPMDEYDAALNQQNLEICLDLAALHGAKVSLQTHKLFSLD